MQNENLIKGRNRVRIKLKNRKEFVIKFCMILIEQIKYSIEEIVIKMKRIINNKILKLFFKFILFFKFFNFFFFFKSILNFTF